MKEYILCAAVWYPNIKLQKIIESNVLPINCNKGVVFCGFRHAQCIYTKCSLTGWRDGEEESGESEQGFLTNLNRFVDRQEGWNIAKEANQIIRISGVVGTLYSENLY